MQEKALIPADAGLLRRRMEMSDEGLQVQCPFCGGPAHRLTEVDGCIWRYICSRCHKVFKVDEATGLVVD